jgi:hypothetical protein
MGFFDRFLSRAEVAPLPALAALLEARSVPADLPGLDALTPAFEAHRDPQERETWADAVAQLYQKGLPLPEPWIEAQDHVRPELVPAWKAEREGFWGQPFMDGLCARIRVSGVVMPEAWLTLWDLSSRDVFLQALDHLRHLSATGFERLPSGIYRGTWRDGLDAARLLLPEVWHSLFQGQHPFLAIPNAGTLLAGPQILLPKLMEEVSRCIQSGEAPLQLAVMERIDDKLVTARLQDPHPMSAPQKELKHLDLLEALRVQEQDLDPGLGRSAPMAMLKTQQGKPLTMATWTAGAPVLLPEADLIAFVDERGEALGIFARQTLPRIQELHGESVDIWGPRRVRYEGFPNAEQLARLECFATAEQMKALQNPPANKPVAPAQPTPAAAPKPALTGPAAAAAKAVNSQFSTQPTPTLPRHLRTAGLGVQDKD